MKKGPPEETSVHAIVPVNVLGKSKARLSPILSQVERRQLSVAMLKDVLLALRKAKRVDRITVVSSDKSVRNIARSYRAEFLWEGKRRGLNKGVKLAITNSQRNGANAILIIHSDLPFVKPMEIDRFLEQSHAYSVALAPSKDGSGTNALLMNPPNAIRPVFGPGSFKQHLKLAKQRGVATLVLGVAGIRFDIDTPQDLLRLVRKHPQHSTGRFLIQFKPHLRRISESPMNVKASAE